MGLALVWPGTAIILWPAIGPWSFISTTVENYTLNFVLEEGESRESKGISQGSLILMGKASLGKDSVKYNWGAAEYSKSIKHLNGEKVKAD